MGTPSAIAQAAMMVLLFEEADATKILSGLAPEELRALGREMALLEEVDPVEIGAAINVFADRAGPRLLPAVAPDAIRTLFNGAVGEIKAEGLIREIAPPGPPPPHGALALLPWLGIEALAALVEGENPQVVAVLLCQLESQTAARVLAGLPDAMQADVVHRVATLGPIAPEALSILEEIVAQRLTGTYGTLPLALGGVAEAAGIVNLAARPIEKRVMPELGKRDKALARRVEQAMFKFDLLYELDVQAMGQVLREVDSAILVDALKGIPADQRERFFAAMSSRAADGVRDDIETRGRLKMAEVEAAQREMIAVARRLAAEGAIVFGPGEDDYV